MDAPLINPAAGVLLKILVDIVRQFAPKIDGKWVHLVGLSGAALLAITSWRLGWDSYLSAWMSIFGVAVGVDQLVKRTSGA